MEQTGSPPISQKARPVGLFINGGLGGSVSGLLGDAPPSVTALFPMTLPTAMAWGYIFFLRPEEVIYHYPTRANVIQTLGGAWVDDFGEGLTEITLSGHTGWRRGELNPLGGEEAFLMLRKGCFELYHALRAAAAAAGQDPDTIEMLLVDTLHTTSYVVYPLSLQTRKHRQRALLYQYQVRLIGLRRLL